MPDLGLTEAQVANLAANAAGWVAIVTAMEVESGASVSWPPQWWDGPYGHNVPIVLDNGNTIIIHPAEGNHPSYVTGVDKDGNPFEARSPGDLPGDGWGVGLNPCGNPGYHLWVNVPEGGPVTMIRSQTWQIRAAIRGIRDRVSYIKAAVAINPSLESSIIAAIAGNPQILYYQRAAIRGNPQILYSQRAAIRTERILEYSQEAAVAKEFDLPSNIRAAIQGVPRLLHYTRAAVRGEAQKTVNICALIVKDRTPAIYLEMENFLPQDFDLRSIPNWPSTPKDWRNDSLV